MSMKHPIRKAGIKYTRPGKWTTPPVDAPDPGQGATYYYGPQGSDEQQTSYDPQYCNQQSKKCDHYDLPHEGGPHR